MDDLDHLFIFCTSFNCIRILDNTYLQNTKFSIEMKIYPIEECNDTDYYIATDKLNFWFDNVVDGSIIFCHTNKWAKNCFIDNTLNDLMITPEDPTDDHLALLLRCKSFYITQKAFNIGSMTIVSDISNIKYVSGGDPLDYLPDSNEYLPKNRWFDKAWWLRGDGSMLDLPKQKGEEEAAWEFSLTFLEELDMTKGELVKYKFQPKII